MRVVLFGGGQTRTDELRRGGIYSPLQLPLCDTPRREKRFCWRKDLNPQPSDYKSGALPVELHQQNVRFSVSIGIFCLNPNLYDQVRFIFFMFFFRQGCRGHVLLEKPGKFTVCCRGVNHFCMKFFTGQLGFTAFFILFARSTGTRVVPSNIRFFHLFANTTL